jgi:hypothetical protein
MKSKIINGFLILIGILTIVGIPYLGYDCYFNDNLRACFLFNSLTK